MAKVIKEIIIMLLICLISMLVLAVVLYDYIPNRKVVAEIKNATSYAFYDETRYATNNERTSNALKYVYFTRNVTEEDNKPSNYSGNVVARFNVTNGEVENLETDGSSTYTIKDISLSNLYYTRSEARGTATSLALLYRQDVNNWNYRNEVTMSNIAYTNYYICDFGYDLFLGTTDNAVYRVMKDGNNNIKSTQIFTSAETILGIYGGCGYYAVESAIYKFDILNGEITDNVISTELASDDKYTMLVDNPHLIDFDNQRLYVFTQYVSSSDKSHYYLNFVEPNSHDQKFVGVFEEDHLPDAPEEEDSDGDGVVENIPHVN